MNYFDTDALDGYTDFAQEIRVKPACMVTYMELLMRWVEVCDEPRSFSCCNGQY